MKQLLLLRHGKAEDSSPAGDYGRELTGSGRRDVESVAAAFHDGSPRLGAIVSSGAARANETAEIAARKLKFRAEITFNDAIYDAEPEDLLTLIRELDDEHANVMFVGHNPGFEELVNMLTKEDADYFAMPKAGLAWIELPIKKWRDAAPGLGRLKQILSPSDLKR